MLQVRCVAIRRVRRSVPPALNLRGLDRHILDLIRAYETSLYTPGYLVDGDAQMQDGTIAKDRRQYCRLEVFVCSGGRARTRKSATRKFIWQGILQLSGTTDENDGEAHDNALTLPEHSDLGTVGLEEEAAVARQGFGLSAVPCGYDCMLTQDAGRSLGPKHVQKKPVDSREQTPKLAIFPEPRGDVLAFSLSLPAYPCIRVCEANICP